MSTVVSIAISLRHLRRAQDRQKIHRHPRRAADQAAIDVRHRENRGSVLRLDATAVKNRRLHRYARAQKSMNFLRLLGRRVAAGADRPYRLVGEHAALELD